MFFAGRLTGFATLYNGEQIDDEAHQNENEDERSAAAKAATLMVDVASKLLDVEPQEAEQKEADEDSDDIEYGHVVDSVKSLSMWWRA